MASNRIVVNTGVGATSCFSTRLHDAIAYHRQHGKYPAIIDSAQQFTLFRDYTGQDVASLVFGEYKPNDNLEFVSYSHDWQYCWYDEIHIKQLAALARMICPLSSHIGNRAYNYARDAQDKLIERTAVLYRGNDKALEIPRTNYEAMIEMAIESKSEKFIVQTDEQEFFDYFKERFPDTVAFDNIPRISKNPDGYVMTPVGQRVDFLLNFIGALYVISECDKLILNTGNTGIWTVLFRGHINNVWQYNSKFNAHKKL